MSSRPTVRSSSARSRRMRVLYHREQLRHRPRFEWLSGRRVDHFERSGRPGRILDALARSHRFDVEAPKRPLPIAELERMHAPAMVRYLRNVCGTIREGAFYPNVFPRRDATRMPTRNLARAGWFCFDAGTPITRWTFEAARLSAACAAEGASLLLSGKETEIYALSRPPGHHAEHGIFGGYCYFNNAALAAQRLRKAGRVAIVDIDFHHGNGTQALFWRTRDVLFVSIHGSPSDFFPYFSGHAEETGAGPGAGRTLNIPLPAGVDDAAYRRLMERRILPALRDFLPRSLVISAGFDTWAGDPVGAFDLTTPFYAELGALFASLGLPTLVVQEGGYNLSMLGENVRTFLEGFLDQRTAPMQQESP